MDDEAILARVDGEPDAFAGFFEGRRLPRPVLGTDAAIVVVVGSEH
jgi:hypothetical protein